MSYDALNKISIHDVKMSESGVSLIADLTSAYDSNVGVSKYLRQFDFNAPGDFLIEDKIATDRPEIVTSYLHSDNSSVQQNGGFEFEGGGKPNLFVDVIEPTGYDSSIGPNFLTAPGRPGSVDKGEREQRGVRLAISTKQPVKQAIFRIRLKIK